MKQIKFSHNWNNKLNNDIFTTIRKSTSEKQKYYNSLIGEQFEVMLKDSARGIATLLTVHEFEYRHIHPILLLLDTGIEDYYKIEKVFRKFGMTSVTDKFLILTFWR